MALVRKLVMGFELDSGSKVSMSVLEPKQDLEDIEIKSAMKTVVDKPIFEIKGSSIVKALSAFIIETDTTEFDFMK